MASVGHKKRTWKDAFSVAGAIQETCSSEMLGGQGADFLRGVAFWSIRSSVSGRWFCVTGAALRTIWHQFFVAGAILKISGKIAKRNGTISEGSLAELLHFWCCQLEKTEEVLQNSFVFDVVEFEKLRKSRWIAALLMLSSSTIEDVSQNSFLFKLADR